MSEPYENETPLGIEYDGGNDEYFDEYYEEDYYDYDEYGMDDPNPYHGTYSEE